MTLSFFDGVEERPTSAITAIAAKIVSNTNTYEEAVE